MNHMDVPMDYDVWNTILGHHQRHISKLVNEMLSGNTVLSTIQNDLLHEFIDKKFVSFPLCVAATTGHW